MPATGKKKRYGFSIIEIMLTVSIMGILASISIPAFRQVRDRAEAAVVINDVRVFTSAIEIYAVSNGQFPFFWDSSALSNNAASYFPPAWTNGTYRWWVLTAGGLTRAFVFDMDLTTGQSLRIDQALDNGNLATGDVRIIANNTLVYHFR